jgi:GNAT superfamily N-acetyltransferase
LPGDHGPDSARVAGVGDVDPIRELERRAGEPFRSVGLDAIADDAPPDAAELTVAVDDGRILVVDDPTPPGHGRPAAWLWVGVADGDLLIEQVSVDPAHRGKRLGTGLVSLAIDHARHRGFPGVSLTSFLEVPWNGPLYRRLGFHPVPDDALGPDLAAIRAAERAAGLDVAPRSAFRLVF